MGGMLHCQMDKCMLYCMDGFMVEGNAKAKCEKDKKGNWSFNKDFGVCVECGDDCPEVEKPEMPDMEKPMCEEGEDCEEKPEKPMCEEGEDCEEMEKPDCEEGEDCEEIEGEKPDMDGEKPDMEEMPDVFGDDGKWSKCEPEPVDMGKIHCVGEKCMLYCMEGFVVDGNGKAKCEKNKNGKWKFNKEFGSCVECGDDCPEVVMPEMPDMGKPEDEEEKPMCEEGEDCEDMPEKPEDDEEEGKPEDGDMPDVFGDDGKWTKCEPEPVENGKISCTDVKCALFCMD